MITAAWKDLIRSVSETDIVQRATTLAQSLTDSIPASDLNLP